jgi:hypothetical protein
MLEFQGMKAGRKRNPSNYRVDRLLGREKRCSRCGEWWPADTEFFNRQGAGLHCWCKACVIERCYELRGGLSGWAVWEGKSKK